MMSPQVPRVVRLGSLSSESVSPIFTDLDLRNADKTRGRFEVSPLQELGLVRSITRGARFEALRLRHHIRRASTHALFVCVPLKGSVALSQAGQNCQLLRGDIALIDSRTEYALSMSEELDALWIRVPPEKLEERLPVTSNILAHRLDGSQGLGLIASRFILSIASQADILSQRPIAPIASILVDLLCAAASDLENPQVPTMKRAGARTLERAREFIEHHLGEEDLTPDIIAAGTGISTRYLAALFAGEGTTTMKWVLERRLELTKISLQTCTWTPGIIAEVAFRHGFGNISSFNRAFRQAYGISPRRVISG